MYQYNKYLWQNSNVSEKFISLVSETVTKIVVLRLIHFFDLLLWHLPLKTIFTAIHVYFIWELLCMSKL